MALVLGGLTIGLWRLTDTRNERMMETIEEMETGASSNPDKIRSECNAYAESVKEAVSKLRAREFNQAALVFYHAYPRFENYLNARGFVEVEAGLTVRQWHEPFIELITSELSEAYEQAKVLLANGDYSALEMRSFVSHLPFAYKRDIEMRWRDEKASVERLRAKRAGDWVIVRVLGSMGSSDAYEAKVREAMASKFDSASPYKLVFGGTMSRDEELAAALVVNAHIEGDEVRYQAVNDSELNSSQTFHETLTVTFDVKSKLKETAATTWDKMPVIRARHQAPQELTATFDRFEKDRRADYSAVLEKQRRQLLEQLAVELEGQLPAFGEG